MDADARPATIVGVIPNFSEGRDRGVIDAIVDALAVPGARVVYAEADADHNRLDTTVLGDPDAVTSSAMAGAATAIELIDMTSHSGGHPRMGAADVIPFMPVRGITMEACADLARGFGRRLAESLDVPVYLYGAAAVIPERASLADVRRGEFECLREAVARGERLPDFGPHEIGRAGATAVGARAPLVAFNVYLSGTDEQAAKDIAKRVRESGGGLPSVRAIGFAVPERGGVITVSMNLVDHDVTGVVEAFDGVVRLSAEHGLEVTDSEIVGLAPASALGPGVAEHVRLEGFDPDRQILERQIDPIEEGPGRSARVSDEQLGSLTVEGFCEVLASDAPTPGGGAVGAIEAAAAAALISMVGRLTIGKAGFEDMADRMRAMVDTADAARADFLELADRDAHAFDSVMQAFRMPKETDDEKAARSAAIQAGYLAAASVPQEVARKAVDLMELAEDATAMGNPQAASDGLSAAASLYAGALCAIANVEINASSLKDEAVRATMLDELASLKARADQSLKESQTAFQLRLSS